LWSQGKDSLSLDEPTSYPKKLGHSSSESLSYIFKKLFIYKFFFEKLVLMKILLLPTPKKNVLI